jgi:hypothetical protein
MGQIVDGFMEFYHDIMNSEERKISWSKFMSSVKSQLIEDNYSTKTKLISESVVNKLIQVWE